LKKDRTIESAIFDAKLIDSGNWSDPEKKGIETWTKISDFDDKRIEASKLVVYLILTLLKDDCTLECKMRSRRLAGKMIHFEDLLYTTRGGLAKKFYRDHLNHMLRVALLSRAIAKNVTCLNFSDEEIRMLTIAALMHDVAYPLAEASKMLVEVASAMEECYSSLKLFRGEPFFNIKNILELFENLSLNSDDLSVTDLANSLEKHNHGLIGALEFLSYVDDCQRYSSVIEAIAFHDSDFSFSIPVLEKKILTTLILSDEMQDWGRPVSFEKEPAIAEIKDFALKADMVQGRFDLSKGPTISPFRQIYAKLKNISRIEMNKIDLRIQLSFLLPEYKKFDFNKFENLLQSVYDYHPQMMRFPEGISKEMFLESYYGIRLSDEEENRIIEALSQKKLVESSLFSSAPLHIDETRLEVLHIPTDLGKLQEAVIRNENGIFNLGLMGEKDTEIGFLSSQQEAFGLKFCERIVGEILIFHLILADIRKIDLTPIGLYLTKIDMKNILNEAGITSKEEIIDHVASIHKCLQNNGFFSFLPAQTKK